MNEPVPDARLSGRFGAAGTGKLSDSLWHGYALFLETADWRPFAFADIVKNIPMGKVVFQPDGERWRFSSPGILWTAAASVCSGRDDFKTAPGGCAPAGAVFRIAKDGIRASVRLIGGRRVVR